MKKILILLLTWVCVIPTLFSQVINRSLVFDGRTRAYAVYLPSVYDNSDNMPLIINLHGFLGSMEFQMDISDMNTVAEEEAFVVVYPQGLLIQNVSQPALPSEGPGWNTGLPLFETDVDDVGFINALIDAMILDYKIDQTRVYVTGFSLGGDMAIKLACELSDRIAAIAPVSGSHPDIDNCSPGKGVPVFYTNGTADVLVPFDGGAPGIPTSIPDAIDFWLTNNDCLDSHELYQIPNTNTMDNSTVSHLRYRQCADDKEVWLYRVNGGGHWWPGESMIPPGFEFFGPVNRDINLSEHVWEFFKDYALDEVSDVTTLDTYELNLNIYPNPFMDEIAFEFNLDKRSNVQLTIFNSMGQTLETLVINELSKGNHVVDWNMSDRRLTPGVYTYQLRLDDQQISGLIMRQ